MVEIPEQSTPQSTQEPTDEELLIFTIRTGSGEVLKIQKVDKSGAPGDISDEECRRIAGTDDVDEVESALDAGYEAGINEVVGDGDFLERLMLLRLLASRRSESALGTLRRDMLRRMLLGRLIRRALQKRNGRS